jgi:dihydrolipoamide dehydrogenase
MMNRKEYACSKANVDIAYLMKKNKIDVLAGVGSLLLRTLASPTAGGGKLKQLTKNVIIATGSAHRCCRSSQDKERIMPAPWP